MELKNTNHKLKGTLVRISMDELKSRGLVQVPTALPQSKGGIVIRVKDVSLRTPAVKHVARFGTYGRIVPWLYSSFPGETKMMTRTEVKKLRKKGVRVRIIGSVVSQFACRPLAPGLESVTSSVSHSESIAVLSSPECGGGRMSVSIGASGRGGRGDGGFRFVSGKRNGIRPTRKERLEKLLLVVIEVKEEIERLIEEENRDKGTSDMPPPSMGLFKEYIDEAKLAECFHQMYNDKARTVALHGKYGKDIDFVALLYVLVVDYKMGSKKLGVKPFHEFFEKYVLTDEQKIPCYKTMANRLNLQFYNLIKWAQTKNGIQIIKSNVQDNAEKNYLTVRGIFHETDYYKQIKCLLRK